MKTKNKERPILFSTEMVQAILEGRKTMTRRIIKPQPDDDGLWNDTKYPRALDSELKGWNGVVGETGESKGFRCPFGDVGDLLWVRETWMRSPNRHIQGMDEYKYKASVSEQFIKEWPGYWKPSIFMPKEACRIRLEVTGVRVERLQSITSDDAKGEGVKEWMKVEAFTRMKGLNYNIPRPFSEYQFSFLELWCRINGIKSWEDNPWVWVIEFKRI